MPVDTRNSHVGWYGAFEVVDPGASWELFDATLARILPLTTTPSLVVDERGLVFIDHRAMLVLERHAREQATEIVLRTDAVIMHRLVRYLGLRFVRVG